MYLPPTDDCCVLRSIISEDRVVFDVIANIEKGTSMQQLKKEVAPVDLKGVYVCVCVHACACVHYCECVSGWWTCTFTCINMYYLDAGEAMATRLYNRLTVFGHHEVCTPSRKMCMHIPHLY